MFELSRVRVDGAAGRAAEGAVASGCVDVVGGPVGSDGRGWLVRVAAIEGVGAEERGGWG